jgi:hypothetical protein
MRSVHATLVVGREQRKRDTGLSPHRSFAPRCRPAFGVSQQVALAARLARVMPGPLPVSLSWISVRPSLPRDSLRADHPATPFHRFTAPHIQVLCLQPALPSGERTGPPAACAPAAPPTRAPGARPSMHPIALGERTDRQALAVAIPADLLEQLHSGTHPSCRPPSARDNARTLGRRSDGSGARSSRPSGPTQAAVPKGCQSGVADLK